MPRPPSPRVPVPPKPQPVRRPAAHAPLPPVPPPPRTLRADIQAWDAERAARDTARPKGVPAPPLVKATTSKASASSEGLPLAVGVGEGGGGGLPPAVPPEVVVSAEGKAKSGGEGLPPAVTASLAGMTIAQVSSPFAAARAVFEKGSGPPPFPKGPSGSGTAATRPAAIVRGKVWEARRASYAKVASGDVGPAVAAASEPVV